MYGKNFHQQSQIVRAFAPAVKAATITGSTIDRKGFREATFKITSGAIIGTPSFAGKLQHGDAANASDMADITGATFAALAAADKEATLRINLNACKRYIRYVGTLTGTTSLAMSGECILTDPLVEPTTKASGHVDHVNVEPDTTS